MNIAIASSLLPMYMRQAPINGSLMHLHHALCPTSDHMSFGSLKIYHLKQWAKS